MPKRKYSEVSDAHESKARDHAGVENCNDEPEKKRPRKSVNFESVHVFYFNRTQGFVCVPSQGGTTLGMSDKHQSKEVYALSDYLRQRKMLRNKRECQETSSNDSFELSGDAASADGTVIQDTLLSGELTDAEGSEAEDGEDSSSSVTILPVPVRRRRLMLHLSGVRKIDSGEKEECHEIRQSREYCGCSCQVFCDPSTCACSKDGIQCQVDRMRFPCGCTREGCGNKTGRIEFNPARVRTHFVHTLMRLELEKQLGNPKATSVSSPAVPSPLRKHIRFSDDGEPSEHSTGEPHFNSNELGSCRDCNQLPVAESPYFSSPASMQCPGGACGIGLSDSHSQLPLLCHSSSGALLPRTCSKGFDMNLITHVASTPLSISLSNRGHAYQALDEFSLVSQESSGGNLLYAQLSGPAPRSPPSLQQPLEAAGVSEQPLATSLCLEAVSGLLTPLTNLAGDLGDLPCSSSSAARATSWFHYDTNDATSRSKCDDQLVGSEFSGEQWMAGTACQATSAEMRASCFMSTASQYFLPDILDSSSHACAVDHSVMRTPAISSSSIMTSSQFSCGSTASSDVYLPFQHSTGEGLYTDADPVLANFCHHSKYLPISSSSLDGPVTASQESSPFTDLVEAVYETVSA